MNTKKYLITWLTVLILFLLVAMTVNYFVNPYAMFNTANIAGFNEIKPAVQTRVSQAKPYQVLGVEPKGLIIGNSRPEMGLDPEHQCWPESAKPVFNMATPGISFYRQVRFAQHAVAAGDVKLVVFGMDFIDFLVRPGVNADPTKWPVDERESVSLLVDGLGQTRDQFAMDRLKDMFKALASLNTLSDSVVTVVRQNHPSATTRTWLGFNEGERIYLPIIHSEGQKVLFKQKNDEVAARLARYPWRIYHSGTTWSTSFEALRRLIDYLKQKDIKLILFVNPYHADYLETIHRANLWRKFELWKSRLAEISEETQVELWDFSDYDRYSTEALKQDGKRGHMIEWFWEPAHYKRELGDKMLTSMLSETCGVSEHVYYGEKINMTRIDQHLSKIRQRRKEYLSQ